MLRKIGDIKIGSELDRRRIADGAALDHDGQSRLLIEDLGDLGDSPRHEGVGPMSVSIQQLMIAVIALIIFQMNPHLTGRIAENFARTEGSLPPA
jgi:hypothetical protein